ncbi:MAG TPA: FIST N-terminal domain-containing protein [Candidatus Dormibacteraeota bacterium]|nr:FIST N-terminal domain-containing protein [Candidatus Dormibacteraeota bacterium]
MKWASAGSDEARLDQAIARAASIVRAELGGCQPDLVVAFVSPHHAAEFDRVPARIAEHLPGALLLGCSGGGVIGGGREIEQRPGVSLTAAYLPGVTITPLYLANDRLPAPDADPSTWSSRLAVDPAGAPQFVLLSDPFTFDAESLIRGLDRAYPDTTTVGGIASGGREAGSNALFLGERVHRGGMVGLALGGNVQVDTIVAQGCRPIGEPMFVTACERNVIRALDGRPPLAVLQELHDKLQPRDRQLARHSLFLGIVMKEDRQQYGQGDFLIRNLIGIDQSSGALAIGALIDANAIVQFHLRDADTSAQDLEALLKRHRAADAAPPAGSLLFSCLGRGQFLYGRVDHDTDLFRRYLGDVPLGGFFCNGEIGPVHGATFLHGYTSAFALFRGRDS